MKVNFLIRMWLLNGMRLNTSGLGDIIMFKWILITAARMIFCRRSIFPTAGFCFLGKYIFRRHNLFPALLILIFAAGMSGLTGCSSSRNVYSMQSETVEKMRSELDTVGVAVASYRAETKILRPAKGSVGGAGRGIVVGASTTVVAGAVSPVPGGTFIGILLAPVGAIVGMIYGALTATSAAEVEKAEKTVDQTISRLQAMNPMQTLRNETIRMGLERTDLTFIALPGHGPKKQNEVVRYDLLDTAGIDTVLELRAEAGGLRGRYTISPPSAAYLKIHARLIMKSDSELLMEDTIFCASEKRDYSEWSENEGQLFFEALISCLPDLTEKIIDDFFLVYPTNSKP
jgi:hypothetical protein